MPTRRHWLRRGGALDADIEMFFMSPSVPESAPELCSMAAYTTAELAPLERVDISALIIVVQSADAVNRAASKFSHLALRLPRERRPSWPLIIPGGRPFLNGVMVRSI